MSDALTVKDFDKTVVIQFNRPEIRSPLSVFVLDELHEIFDRISDNTIIGAVIITGKNDVFASGADLREIAKISKDTAAEFALRGQTLMNKIALSEKKTVAAINGFCFGGALDLALACKKRIASPNAVFSHPGASLGIITGWGGTQRLPRLVGEAAALEMFLTAKRIDAGDALQIGLIDKISVSPVEDAIEYVNLNLSM